MITTRGCLSYRIATNNKSGSSSFPGCFSEKQMSDKQMSCLPFDIDEEAENAISGLTSAKSGTIVELLTLRILTLC